MPDSLRRHTPWAIAWCLICAVGAFVLVRLDIATRREAFQAEARAAHRQLSQRAAQHEAILATLALLDAPASAKRPERRLIALYPQVLAVLRRGPGEAWPVAGLAEAEARARGAGGLATGPVDMGSGRFWLVRAADATGFALQVAIERMLPGDDWPFAFDGPVRATLAYGNAELVLNTGEALTAKPAGLTEGFVFAAPLAVASQPFELRVSRATGPAQWPWPRLGLLALATALALAALAARRRSVEERQRAAALARIQRVERLNALGEYAGGVAHELNQPLTAVLASTQAAERLLAEDEPDLPTLRTALARAAAQARRAADVLALLRRRITSPAAAASATALHLPTVARRVADLFAPAIGTSRVTLSFDGEVPPVKADPVALEQILHNLLDNALRALQSMPAEKRRLDVAFAVEDGLAVCRIADSGPGIAPEMMAHLFEPLRSTREAGMGLGLALARSLAEDMGGALSARNASTGGAEFRLALPLAAA